MSGQRIRPLRFGIQLQAQRTTWSAYVEAVQKVEALGFDSLWNFDHMLPFAGADDESCFETLTTLAAVAARTTRIRIGALVNGVLYRDPATLAKAAAMVDQISGGRLVFSLGAAWAEREFAAYGLAFPPIGERMARLEETLEIVKLLWAQHRTTFEGRYYSVHDAPCEPKPVQRPYPPILIGGGGPRTIRIAAKHATEWNGIGSPDFMAGRIALLRDECSAIGRDPHEIEVSAHLKLSVARTTAKAEAAARAFCATLDQDFDSQAGEWVLGTPEAAQRQVQAYVDVGVTHWIFGVGAPFDVDMYALFAREVVPAFR